MTPSIKSIAFVISYIMTYQPSPEKDHAEKGKRREYAKLSKLMYP